MGAEKSGRYYLAGGWAEGWEAPPLNGQSLAPLHWTPEDFYHYLRHGFTPRHGVAAGPMAPVIEGLSALPDSDLHAMAQYLSSLGAGAKGLPASDVPLKAAGALEPAASNSMPAPLPGGPGERTFNGACAACHEPGRGPTLFSAKPALALNSNLHSRTPDNLIQVILGGIHHPAQGELGYMPAFSSSFTDRQIEELVGYLRMRFAPGQPAWQEVDAATKRIRRQLTRSNKIV
jgi:nicotinate dehydrogenase subunit B